MIKGLAMLATSLSLTVLCAWPPQGPSQQGDISGFVADEAGYPLPQAEVRLLVDGNLKAQEVTGDDGAYSFECLEDGKYSVEFRRDGFATTVVRGIKFRYPFFRTVNQSLHFISTDHFVVVTTTHRLRINVVGPDEGRPLGEAKVQVLENNQVVAQRTADTCGRMLFELTEGEYKVRAEHRGFRTSIKVVRVPETGSLIVQLSEN